ncbi:50S ribosomal protein L2 [Chloracidobacterium validum]|uniref:Large ribosomal subunit protein uL2 n=1 Tax=Chloracidobacterium validum TaxID=2821543 RepID=A0ABX8B962_9BACT|nr:50S ribosomal protein L2 [Chloracidobacterium validum]QUW03474.1 50S ribosomal protein L2 [Chloracidobacterium validum]
MSVKTVKPTSPARRFQTFIVDPSLSRERPLKSLTEKKEKISGRNNDGRVTTRHRGGGHKRLYRIIDFKRNKLGVPGKVERIEYDPNRSSRIALISYLDGEKRYILAPVGLTIGQLVMAGPDVDIVSGNALPLKKIPLGTEIHNIELRPGKGGQVVRAAGAKAQLIAKDDKMAQIRMPSGEVRKILVTCYATIGQVGNLDHENVSLGKAGRARWRGLRPEVRGVAMNPVDHPHGGGEGRTSGGRHPVTPWGIQTRGYKTRHNKQTEKYIVRRRGK